LAALASSIGVEVRFLKPHGALYNQAQRDGAVAAGVVAASREIGLPVLGLPGGRVEAAAAEVGVRFVAEGYADRRYGPDGRLVPRTEPGAILEDPGEVADQVLRLVERGVATLCVHGDNPKSVGLADLVRSVLERAGVAVRSFA